MGILSEGKVSHRSKKSLSSRQSALGRVQKLRGSLKGKPSVLEFLLEERRKDRDFTEAASKRARSKGRQERALRPG